MYDAILFLVMVSLAGVILLPALHSNIALESSLEKHREQTADEALHTFLVSRTDLFQYRFSGSLIDDVAASIGIDNSSDGLYGSITHWLLAHEQRHKTYAALLAEDLGCQFRLPLSIFGTNRFNIFTGDYDKALINETEQFFSSYLSDKYQYNLTAWWHPIKGVPLGGELSLGEKPPKKDCYVARSEIMMPYTPIITISNHTFVFTKHWLKNQLFSETVGFGRSSIPALANITRILENYTQGHPPFDTRENATSATQENLSTLVYGFLIDGIRNETNITVFPGIINMTLTYGFEKIKNITDAFLKDAINESFGEAIRTIDQFFGSLNESTEDPVTHWILEDINTTIHQLLNSSFGSLNEAFDALQLMIQENVTILIKNFLDPHIEMFVTTVFDIIDATMDFAEMIIDWLFDRISLNKAEVTLTIWVVRE
jgi:hypothetical protein